MSASVKCVVKRVGVRRWAVPRGWRRWDLNFFVRTGTFLRKYRDPRQLPLPPGTGVQSNSITQHNVERRKKHVVDKTPTHPFPRVRAHHVTANPQSFAPPSPIELQSTTSPAHPTPWTPPPPPQPWPSPRSSPRPSGRDPSSPRCAPCRSPPPPPPPHDSPRPRSDPSPRAPSRHDTTHVCTAGAAGRGWRSR